MGTARFQRACLRCDEAGASDRRRLVCGCLWDETVKESDSVLDCRLAAARAAKRKGRRKAGVQGAKPTGVWHVRDKDLGEELVECSEWTRA